MTDKWNLLERKAIENQELRQEDLLAILESSDSDVLSLVESTRRVRERYFGRKVKLQYLINIKSGLCSEDCHYCSQSKVSKAPIQKYSLMSPQEILACAKRGVEAGATKVCLVASGETPSLKEIAQLEDAIPALRKTVPEIELCASLGILDEVQAKALRSAGIDTYNHNFNTSEEFYKEICTTHSYADRVRTVTNVRQAGMHICSGIIAGMGESPLDLVKAALALKQVGADHIPVNFLIPIEKTPLAEVRELTPMHALRILAMMRMANPTKELRIAGGREVHLRSLQPLGLMLADSIFIGDYLTTKGQTAAMDLAMIRDLGYTIKGRPDNFINQFFSAHPDLQNGIGTVLA